MNSIFKKKKNPEQLVKMLKDALAGATESDPSPAAQDELTKRISQVKLMLYGEGDQESTPQKCNILANLLIKEGLLHRLILELPSIAFEAKKHLAQIYNNIMRRDLAHFVAYVAHHPMLLSTLVAGYESPDLALNCGSMLRESIKHKQLAKILLYSDDLWKFFDVYVHLPNFDIASDAFASFKDLFIRHKSLGSEFLEEHFDQVFEKYNKLLESDNYVTRRQSLKLLGEILLDRSNFNIMMRYISKKENLKMMMNLLRDKSGNIQFEAFHVFKVFVANPKKPDDITQILLLNKDKLIAYLKAFHNEKEDEQFNEEKNLLISTLTKLSSDAMASTSVSVSAT